MSNDRMTIIPDFIGELDAGVFENKLAAALNDVALGVLNNGGKGKGFPMGVRPYSVREYARLQGVPDTFIFPVSDTAAYRQIGNGVSKQVGEWIGNEVTRYMNQ